MQALDDADCGTPSLLTPIGYQTGDCGYCKGENSSRTPDSRASYYARSKSLCPRHYQLLMDRGWRRSGHLLYLPDASRSCCPHYTIRLPASELRPIRDQRQALNRWNRHVLGEKYIKHFAIKYPKSKEEKKRQNTTFDLLEAVHECESANLKADVEPAHRLVVTLESDTFTEEKFQLFSNYQQHVHHETEAEISRGGFQRFLCSSPLHRHNDNGKQLGSFHQTYRLDGRLIAMSVLDLLPLAVSGVYFIYHSDFEKWSFGKLSALREAALAIEGGYGWMYMGYYIHSCIKMRYKGDYKTQQVLDSDTFQWAPLDDEMRRLMEKRRHWISMSRERGIRKAMNQSQTTPITSAADPEGNEANSPEQALVNKAYAVQHPTPLAAMQSNLSMLQLGVPGVMGLSDLLAEVDLGEVNARIAGHDAVQMQDLVMFDQGDVLDNGTIKGIVAELAAAVGPVVAGEVLVDWRFQ